MLKFLKKSNMPGRLVIYDDIRFKEECGELIKFDMVQKLNPSYNIAPTLAIPVLLNNGNYLYGHFGFLPSWAKDRTSMNINARSESIFEKQTFREAFKSRRCIVPINGFYEWKKQNKEKIPFYVSSKKNNYMGLAGIWDEWFDKDLNMKIVTLAIITCDANDKLGEIHHRMPVVLEKENFSSWLNSSNIEALNKMFRIYESENIQMQEVSKEINKVSFNEISCLKQVFKKDIKIKEEKISSLFDL